MPWDRRTSILPPELPAVQHLFVVGRVTRETLDPFVPCLIWQTADDDTGMTPLYRTPDTGIGVAVDNALRDLPVALGHPVVWFAVLVDSYGRITTDTDDHIDADDLTDRFILGDPAVVEQLMALVAYDGEVRIWRQVYRHSISDGWEWESPEWMAHPVLPDNGLLDIMRLHADDLA